MKEFITCQNVYLICFTIGMHLIGGRPLSNELICVVYDYMTCIVLNVRIIIKYIINF